MSNLYPYTASFELFHWNYLDKLVMIVPFLGHGNFSPLAKSTRFLLLPPFFLFSKISVQNFHQQPRVIHFQKQFFAP